LDEVLAKSKAMTFRLDSTMVNHLDHLQKLLRKYPGTTGIQLEVQLEEFKKTVTLEVQDPEGIRPNKAFFDDVHALFGRTDFVQIGKNL
jgi:hypothetical protein